MWSMNYCRYHLNEWSPFTLEYFSVYCWVLQCVIWNMSGCYCRQLRFICRNMKPKLHFFIDLTGNCHWNYTRNDMIRHRDCFLVHDNTYMLFDRFSAAFTLQWKMWVWLNTSVAPAWGRGGGEAWRWVWSQARTLQSTCETITVVPDSMYVQNVKTVWLFISRRSCSFSDVDASGAWPNKAVSNLNCLQPLSCVWKVPRPVWLSREKNTKLSASQIHVSTHTIMPHKNLYLVYEKNVFSTNLCRLLGKGEASRRSRAGLCISWFGDSYINNVTVCSFFFFYPSAS